MEKTVVTTYLEMTDINQFIPKEGYESKIQIRRVDNDTFINFMLFAGVGLPFRWSSRFRFSVEDWEKYFEETDLRTYFGFHGESVIGYFELIVDGENTEIKFFGLFPKFTGKRLGSSFLSHAIHCAWETGARRVWVHTCTSDHAAALPNYLARGFKIYDEKSAVEDVPENEKLVGMISEFFRDYLLAYGNELLPEVVKRDEVNNPKIFKTNFK